MVQRHARVRQRLRSLPLLRSLQQDDPEGQVRDRHVIPSGSGGYRWRGDWGGPTEKLLKYNVYRHMLADHFDEPEDKAIHKAGQFEREIKRRFLNERGK